MQGGAPMRFLSLGWGAGPELSLLRNDLENNALFSPLHLDLVFLICLQLAEHPGEIIAVPDRGFMELHEDISVAQSSSRGGRGWDHLGKFHPAVVRVFQASPDPDLGSIGTVARDFDVVRGLGTICDRDRDRSNVARNLMEAFEIDGLYCITRGVIVLVQAREGGEDRDARVIEGRGVGR